MSVQITLLFKLLSCLIPHLWCPIYPRLFIQEFSSLVTLPSFMLSFGMLLVWFLGYFLSWRTTAYILTIPPILLTLLILFLPETPYWLIEQNELNDARRSLQFFRGKEYDISDELNEIQQKYEAKNKSSKESWKFIVKRMFSKAFLRPFSCVGILYIINAWVGFIQIQVFVIEILEKSGSSIDPKMAPIIIGFVRLTFAGNSEPKIEVLKFLQLFVCYTTKRNISNSAYCELVFFHQSVADGKNSTPLMTLILTKTK